MRTKKEEAILISFFKSENLGDQELSKELLNLVEKDFVINSIYDFSTLTKINSHYKEELVKKETNKSQLKRKFKKFFLWIIGKKSYKWITYYTVVKRNMHKNLFKDIDSSQRVIIGGGNMLMDRNKTWPLRIQEIIDYSYEKKIKVDIAYVGAGPISSLSTKHIFKKTLSKVETLMVRDYRSKSLLQPYMKTKEIYVGYDPALTYNEEKYETKMKSLNEHSNIILGINIIGEECFTSQKENDRYLKNMQELISFINDEKVEKIILFSTAEKDYKNIYKLSNNINNSKVTIYNLDNYDGIVELYSSLSFLIGGRMHSLIFAQSMFLPYIALAWDTKVYGYLEMLENDFSVINIEEVLNHFSFIKSSMFENSNNKSVIEKMGERNRLISESRNKNQIRRNTL